MNNNTCIEWHIYIINNYQLLMEEIHCSRADIIIQLSKEKEGMSVSYIIPNNNEAIQ